MLSHPQIIAMGSYLTILSEDGNGSNLANYYEHGDEWRNPLSHREIVEAMLFRNPIHNNSMIVKVLSLESMDYALILLINILKITNFG